MKLNREVLKTRLLIISIFIIIFLFLSYGLYRYSISPQPDPNINHSSQTTPTVIEPSGKYIKYTSEALKGISFEYPDNWILTPAKDENGQITIRNFDSGLVDKYLINGFEIRITETHLLDSVFLQDIMNLKNLPQKDDEGYSVTKSESFFSKQEGSLSLKQETNKYYLTFIPYGSLANPYFQIKVYPKNSKYISEYQKVVDSFQHNVRETYLP